MSKKKTVFFAQQKHILYNHKQNNKIIILHCLSMTLFARIELGTWANDKERRVDAQRACLIDGGIHACTREREKLAQSWQFSSHSKGISAQSSF
jgi:hypothetical protein